MNQAEEESESVIESFSSGNLSVDQFIDAYVEARKVFHLRKAKMECLG